MRKKNLLELLRTLNKEEFNRIELFLKSPYFNTNKTLLYLFQILIKHFPDFDFRILTNAYLLDLILPKKKITEGTLKNYKSELYQLLLQFLIHEKLHKEPVQADQLLYDCYAERRFRKEFKSLYHQKVANKNGTKTLDRIDHLNIYHTLNKFYHFPHTDRREISNDHMRHTLHHLNHFFVLSYLLHEIEIKSRHRLLGEEPPINYYRRANLYFINKSTEEEKEFYKLLLLIRDIQSNPKPASIDGALIIFYTEHNNFSGFDRKMILKTLINEMNRLLQSGNTKYLQEMYKLYRFGIEEGILLYDQSLSIDDYINIIVTSTRCQQINWADYFAKNHFSYLPEDDQEPTQYLASLLILFAQNKFDRVRKSLNKKLFKNPILSFHFILLQLKDHLEFCIKHPDLINRKASKLKSIEKEIRRQGVKEQLHRMELFLNLLKIIRRILLDIKRENPISYEYFEKRIAKNSPIVAKNWLLQKIKSLE